MLHCLPSVFSPVRGWYICWRRTRLRFCLSSDLVVSAERFILVAILDNCLAWLFSLLSILTCLGESWVRAG